MGDSFIHMCARADLELMDIVACRSVSLYTNSGGVQVEGNTVHIVGRLVA